MNADQVGLLFDLFEWQQDGLKWKMPCPACEEGTATITQLSEHLFEVVCSTRGCGEGPIRKAASAALRQANGAVENGKHPSEEERPPPEEPPESRPRVVVPERRKIEGFTAAQLMGMEIKETKWAVEGYISEGLNILAGGQKLGKSWLAFDLAIAVAMSGYAFGIVPVEEGDALYLALEDTPRRLKDRLGKLLQGQPAPDRLTIYTEWPPLLEGGLDWFEGYLTQHPQARLVVIDTLQKIRPSRQRDGNAYAEDYSFMGMLKQMADRYGVAFLVLHHVRKMRADDPFDAVSGTMGLTGAADATMVMQRVRGKTEAILHITGRDIEEREVAMSWERETGMWTILGDADEYRRSQERKAIIELLEQNTKGMAPKEVAEALSKNHSTARVLMMKMLQKGEIQMVSPGKYGPV